MGERDRFQVEEGKAHTPPEGRGRVTLQCIRVRERETLTPGTLGWGERGTLIPKRS